MSIAHRRSRRGLLSSVFVALALLELACAPKRGRLDGASGSGGSAGEVTTGDGGSGGTRISMGGTSSLTAGAAGADTGSGGAAGAAATTDGPAVPTAGCFYEGQPGAGGEAGAPGSAGAAGAGGALPWNISLGSNPFVGEYLQDKKERALYVFGADLAGDCHNEPVTTCFNDCLIAWPVFHTSIDDLPEGIDPRAVSEFRRPDGGFQSTYYGWPLYYFVRDAEPGDVRGHGAGKIWHLAERLLPNIIILRVGDERMLADGTGHVLYVSDADAPGDNGVDPTSACEAECLQEFWPFTLPHLAPVSYLEPSDFKIFIRDDGAPQLTYQGRPLYQSLRDQRSGDQLGLDVPGFSRATP